MAAPSLSSPVLHQALNQILGQFSGTRQQAVDALATLQAGSVDTAWIFNALDTMRDAIARFNRFKTVTGLDSYATAQVPGYAGTISADINTTISAIQACIDWIIANFPKDTTATWILALQLNADGTRTPRSFTSVQTAGLQTRLQTLIATIA